MTDKPAHEARGLRLIATPFLRWQFALTAAAQLAGGDAARGLAPFLDRLGAVPRYGRFLAATLGGRLRRQEEVPPLLEEPLARLAALSVAGPALRLRGRCGPFVVAAPCAGGQLVAVNLHPRVPAKVAPPRAAAPVRAARCLASDRWEAVGPLWVLPPLAVRCGADLPPPTAGPAQVRRRVRGSWFRTARGWRLEARVILAGEASLVLPPGPWDQAEAWLAGRSLGRTFAAPAVWTLPALPSPTPAALALELTEVPGLPFSPPTAVLRLPARGGLQGGGG